MRFLRRAASFVNNAKTNMESDGEEVLSKLKGILSIMHHPMTLIFSIIFICISLMVLSTIMKRAYDLGILQMVDSSGGNNSISASSFNGGSDSTNGGQDGSASADGGQNGSASTNGGHYDIVEKAMSVIGAPYSGYTSGNNPLTGFTCSGLTWWAYNQAGYDIPLAQGYKSYYTGNPNGEDSQMWAVESRGHWKNSLDECSPGDLVFYSPVFDKYNTGHVAIYMGNNQTIEAVPPFVSINSADSSTFVGCGWPLD